MHFSSKVLTSYNYMIYYFILLLLSVVGACLAVYLIRKRAMAKAPVCPLKGDCKAVLSSKYSKTFFISNDVLGLLFYMIISVLSVAAIFNFKPNELWLFLIQFFVTPAAIFSAYLIYLQWRVIKSWCFWCLISAVIVWLMEIIILLIK